MADDTKETTDFSSRPWMEAFRAGISTSDLQIQQADLGDGWDLVRYRAEVVRDVMRNFFRMVLRESSPVGQIAIHALGGTGRMEICPGSDVDVGVVVENVEENKDFLGHLAKRLRQLSPMVRGLKSEIKSNSFTDLTDDRYFELTSMASLLDSDLLAGNASFDQRIRRVCRKRAANLGLDFVFAVNQDLADFDRHHPQEPGDVSGFHVKNGKGGLRNFHLTMWLYAFERWLPSVEVYEQVQSSGRFESDGAPTTEVLNAVGVIFTARCWIEQRRSQQQEAGEPRGPELSIDANDMMAFRRRFGIEGLTRLNRAREVICSYRHETLNRLLERGVIVPDSDGMVVWGPRGLGVEVESVFQDPSDVFFALYRAHQRFRLPIDPSLLRAARKYIATSLRPHDGFLRMMVARGPVLGALRQWGQFHILHQLVPGFRELANQSYDPLHRTAALTRTARALQRIENLELLETVDENSGSPESYFARLYRDLDGSARGALRLALLTDEVPQAVFPDIPYGEAVRRYVAETLSEIEGLSAPTLRTIEFLLLRKREVLKASETSDQVVVIQQWKEHIQALQSRDAADTIRALALFAYAAFDYRSAPGVRPRLETEQWNDLRNLTQNLLLDESELAGQPYQATYFDPLGQRIGSLLPRRLLASPYVDKSLIRAYDGRESLDPQRAHRIIQGLVKVVTTNHPIVEVRNDGSRFLLNVFTWDFPGLFWRIAGCVYDIGCSLRGTDLYEVPDPEGEAMDGETRIPGERRLVFDAISFDPPPKHRDGWIEELEACVQRRLENPHEAIIDNTKEILEPALQTLRPKLTDLGGQLKISCQTDFEHRGVRYAISRLLSERVDADIESIVRDGTRDWPIPRINFYFRAPGNIDTVSDALTPLLGEIREVSRR